MLVSALALAACDQLREAPEAIAVRGDDGVQMMVSDETIAGFFDDVQAPVVETPGTTQRASFDTYRLLVGTEHAYLVGEGHAEDGSCFIFARELRVDGNRYGPMKDDGGTFRTENHSCSGQQGCQGCVFTRGGGGGITGCSCTSPAPGGTGWCSHTVSTGG